VDKSSLARWRTMDAAVALRVLAEHAKQDPSFVARASLLTARWHASVDGNDVELLCMGPKFFDTRAGRGGGGAVDLVMHLFDVDFMAAVRLLQDKDV